MTATQRIGTIKEEHMAVVYHASNDLDVPAGRMEWLRADTIKPWRLQRDLSKKATSQIARDFDPDQLGVLIVTRRGGTNYLLDGQHRLYAIKDILGWGDQNVPCVVYEGLTDAQESKLFNAQAPGKRRQLPPLHAMYVDYDGGDPAVCAAVAAVERAGLRMAFGNTNGGGNTISAAKALLNMARLYGVYRLQAVLELLRESLGPNPSAYSSDMLQGMMAFHIRYDGQYQRALLVEKLRAAGLTELTREAMGMRGVLGCSAPMGTGRAIHKIYNHRKNIKLPEWQDKFSPPDVAEAGRQKSQEITRRDFQTGIRKPTGAVGARMERAANGANGAAPDAAD